MPREESTNNLSQTIESIFKFSEISTLEIISKIRNLKASKSTGIDNIPAKVLKLSADIIGPSIARIFNISLKSGIFVHEWKMAWVLPIYKTDDKRKCENYRRISILPIISKIFERSGFNQVYSYLNDNSLLSKYQAGFHPKNSIMAALIQMCDEWYVNMDKGKLNGVVFLDIRKAFDSINHNILLEKLETQFGISNNELKWFKSYLTSKSYLKSKTVSDEAYDNASLKYFSFLACNNCFALRVCYQRVIPGKVLRNNIQSGFSNINGTRFPIGPFDEFSDGQSTARKFSILEDGNFPILDSIMGGR